MENTNNNQTINLHSAILNLFKNLLLENKQWTWDLANLHHLFVNSYPKYKAKYYPEIQDKKLLALLKEHFPYHFNLVTMIETDSFKKELPESNKELCLLKEIIAYARLSLFNQAAHLLDYDTTLSWEDHHYEYIKVLNVWRKDYERLIQWKLRNMLENGAIIRKSK